MNFSFHTKSCDRVIRVAAIASDIKLRRVRHARTIASSTGASIADIPQRLEHRGGRSPSAGQATDHPISNRGQILPSALSQAQQKRLLGIGSNVAAPAAASIVDGPAVLTAETDGATDITDCVPQPQVPDSVNIELHARATDISSTASLKAAQRALEWQRALTKVIETIVRGVVSSSHKRPYAGRHTSCRASVLPLGKAH